MDADSYAAATLELLLQCYRRVRERSCADGELLYTPRNYQDVLRDTPAWSRRAMRAALPEGGYQLVVPFPRKVPRAHPKAAERIRARCPHRTRMRLPPVRRRAQVFSVEEMATTTAAQAQLVPQGTLILQARIASVAEHVFAHRARCTARDAGRATASASQLRACADCHDPGNQTRASCVGCAGGCAVGRCATRT